MTSTDPAQNGSGHAVLSELPGDLMMWVLIASELLVFGAGLLAFLGARALNPSRFAADQLLLDQTAGALNTLILVTSGLFAALAVSARELGRRPSARGLLVAAILLGGAFLVVKGFEYADKLGRGISIETSPFFMFYYLITGFHAAHVVAGMALIALVAVYDSTRNMETVAAFWHMVDLVWVLLYPIIYLAR